MPLGRPLSHRGVGQSGRPRAFLLCRNLLLKKKETFCYVTKLPTRLVYRCPTIEKRTAGGSVQQPPGETKEMFEENIERPTSS